MENEEKQSYTISKTKRNIAIGLVILSTIFYCLILVIPFLPFAVKTKVIISSAFAVIGEITFWIGGFILGKEMVRKYRKKLNPANWFKK
ncbi:transporter suffix domain-containing protein [Peribacillus glennii]|uniref:Transporter suffix domain-containing protein n=1 Tax=Peribacillus glennii TaxID=2303991 RepID=A0A372LB44_9BACI|nr:transporter suffix domain-containing protein [Peribacillus glennii]RFU62083.1 hypothetical protein D0466_15995 [Peribacillus glennii]